MASGMGKTSEVEGRLAMLLGACAVTYRRAPKGAMPCLPNPPLSIWSMAGLLRLRLERVAVRGTVGRHLLAIEASHFIESALSYLSALPPR